jgi:hypothetical protein
LMEEEQAIRTFRRTRLFDKQRAMSSEPEPEFAPPLQRSGSRRVKDPPLWSDEDDDDTGSIASRTRLGRIRRLKARDQGTT